MSKKRMKLSTVPVTVYKTDGEKYTAHVTSLYVQPEEIIMIDPWRVSLHPKTIEALRKVVQPNEPPLSGFSITVLTKEKVHIPRFAVVQPDGRYRDESKGLT